MFSLGMGGNCPTPVSVRKVREVVAHSHFSRWYLFQNPFSRLLGKFF